MEFLLGAWLWIATWPFLVGFVIFGIWCEYCEHHKFAALTTIVVGLITWKVFEIDNTYALYGAIAYIPVGLVWSVWRWKVHCKRTVDRAIEAIDDKYDSRSPDRLVKYDLAIASNIDRLISWVICWPLSVVERSLSDVIHMIRIMITEWFGNVYKSIAASSVKSYEAAYEKHQMEVAKREQEQAEREDRW